ncbi:hypothetical protein MMC22_008024 [Lobaria immixta]|nr:hypothetical protein [Lobaria immixta]
MSSPAGQVKTTRASSPQKSTDFCAETEVPVNCVPPVPFKPDTKTTTEFSCSHQDASEHGYNEGHEEGPTDEPLDPPRSIESMSLSERKTTPDVRLKDSSISIQEDGRPESSALLFSKQDLFVDPTPKTLCASTTLPSRTPSNAGVSLVDASSTEKHKHLCNASRASTNDDPNLEKPDRPPGGIDEDSKSEIQSIMDQFDSDHPDHGDERSSQMLEFSGSLLGGFVQHPPRNSSLEPSNTNVLKSSSISQNDAALAPSGTNYLSETQDKQDSKISSPAPSIMSPGLPQPARFGSAPNTPSSPNSSTSLRKPLPPEPDPEPDLPFDFHRFLEQLRHRTADPVAKFLRSFLVEFGKKQWMVHEQVKLISDFLAFISNKMSQCEVWRGVSNAEFDNAKEGMEKLVMNRLYSQTFSPAIPLPIPASGTKGKRKNLDKLLGPGRRGQHQEDIERDEILSQKVSIYGWVQEEHLDIRPVGDSGRRFLTLAQQELLKIKTYRAPRDKVICVLNCCKVIFGLLRNSKAADTSADSFVPLLIYVVLHANPEHLVSNVQYILRFRNQDKLGGEAGYYLSSLMGAIQFIENLDRTTLTVSDAEFERNVEAAVFAIAERHKEEMPLSLRHSVSEKSGLSEPEMVPRNSVEAEYVNPVRPTSSRVRILTGDGSDESTAVNGLLRTIQKPLSSIGRMFSEDVPKTQDSGNKSILENTPQLSPPPPRLSPAVFQPPRNSNDMQRSFEDSRESEKREQHQARRLTAGDAAARQASAEAAEAQRIQRLEHDDVIETLTGIFPDLDRDIISDVVRMKQGRVGSAVDACLALNS